MSDPGAGWEFGPAWLFCPADRPDRYEKALERSDQVILDLEDAVAPDRKAAARDAVAGLAVAGVLDVSRTIIRVNGAGTTDHQLDLELVVSTGIERAMLPKSESPDAVANLPSTVVLLCESPAGMERVGELAAVDNVVAVMWGGEDFVTGLGGTGSRRSDGRYYDVVRWARSRCLVAAKAYNRVALDGVYMDIPDLAGLQIETMEAVAVGFDAKVAIHPSQVPVIRDAYRPSAEEVSSAERLLHAAGSGGVFTFEGRMVDGPILEQARRMLLRAGIRRHG
jgi:citrate lyase subunit beta / citryl-CoA lyase